MARVKIAEARLTRIVPVGTMASDRRLTSPIFLPMLGTPQGRGKAKPGTVAKQRRFKYYEHKTRRSSRCSANSDGVKKQKQPVPSGSLRSWRERGLTLSLTGAF